MGRHTAALRMRAVIPRDHNLKTIAAISFTETSIIIGLTFDNHGCSRREIGSFTSLSDREPRRTARRRSLQVAR